MRKTFFDTLKALAKENKSIFLLTADLGYLLFKEFKEAFPERTINVGVAEANMIGIGAGLALSGKNVYCYSIIPFLTMRCFEQIRVDLCYQNVDVKLVGSGAGLDYGLEGVTHHAIEDVSVLRALPNMTIVAPGDPVECRAIARLSASHRGPMFVRLERKSKPNIHRSSQEIEIGKGVVVNEGGGLAIIATGSMLHTAKLVSDSLTKKGVGNTLISMHTIKPLDKKIVLDYAGRAIFTIEEHSVIGGLGSAVAEVLSEAGYSGLFRRIALPDAYCRDIGGQEYLRRAYSLSPSLIEKRILKDHSRRGEIA